ncbi:MAG TPA: DNA methyltransferase [Novosphingobium sp.]|nr:DNA methyltransferase [Novosphingobium sp.]
MTNFPRRHNLHIEHLSTTSLTPNPRNARRHPRKQINKLARIIAKLGFSVPIVIDENAMILAGHGRLEAAIELGLAEVPCVRLSDLSDAEKIAFSIADNRVGEESSHDDAAIKVLLLELTDLNFDTTLTGFDAGEIDFRIDGPAGAILGDPSDLVPADAGSAVPVTQRGELWCLGSHRLFCGSALDAESYDAVLEGELVQMVFTDSPWNVPIHGHVSGLGKHKHAEFAQASGELSETQFRDEFLTPAHTLMAAHSIDGSIHFACIDWRNFTTLITACEKIYDKVKNVCVWVKRAGGMGSLFRSQHEFVVVFKKGKAPHINNVELGKHGRYRTNVWDYPGANSFGPTREADLSSHPTVKPVALVADAIRDCSNRGGLILDPFAGSGTTILAADRTGRRAAGIEIEPRFVDVAIRRWQTLTSREATLASDGRTFAQIESARQVAAPEQSATEGGPA